MTTRHHPINYFSPSDDRFWRWADDGAVIETVFGTTLVYREELADILEGLREHCIPSLDGILLVLAACRTSGVESDHQLRGKVLAELETDKERYNERTVLLAERLLENIRQLPHACRSGPGRLELLRALMEDNPDCEYIEDIQPWLDFLRDGNQRALSFTPGPATYEKLWNGIMFLFCASEEYPDIHALQQRLKSSYDEPPAPLPVEYPDVLTELDADGKTAGLAQLARMLKAVMRLPANPEYGAHDDLGGVSDIGNRGDLHRLLLSELAQDDDMLLARLAHNETLFYRQDHTPAPPQTPKIVAIDVTLRMWGSHRLFAIAAALAWAQHEAPEAWLMTGDKRLAADLATGTGVLEAMAHLSGALHCGDALAATDKALSGVECLYVSSEENFLTPGFQASYTAMKNPPALLALIDKAGKINIYTNFRKHRRLVASATYDLQEVLSAKTHAPTRNDALPAIFSRTEWPLFFPWINRGGDTDRDFVLSCGKVVRYTSDGRLMITTSGLAARQLHPCFPDGTFHGAYDPGGRLFAVLVETERKEYFHYVFDLNDHVLMDYARLEVHNACEVEYWQGKYYFTGPETFSIAAFRTHARRAGDVCRKTGDDPGSHLEVKRNMINVKYTAWCNPDDIHIGAGTGCFCINKMQLVNSGLSMVFIPMTEGSNQRHQVAQKFTEKIYVGENKQVCLRKFVWPGGSMAWSDSRGLMHFRSSDKDLPEITLVAVSGKPIAAWTSDNCVCGSEIFLDRHGTAVEIPIDKFWAKYWQPFLQSIP